MAQQVDCPMTSFPNLGILALLLATIIILYSWNPSSNMYSTEDNALVPKDELQKSVQVASIADDKMVIITIINEAYVQTPRNEYPSMFDIFLEGFWVGERTRKLIDRLVVVAMDKTDHERCRFRRLNCYRLAEDHGGGEDHFAKEKVFMSDEFIEMMWRRTRFLLNVHNVPSVFF